MSAAVLIAAAALSAANVRGYFYAPFAKSADITPAEIVRGYADGSGSILRITDRTDYSTVAGMWAQVAALYERSLRCAGYDGAATIGEIADERHRRLLPTAWSTEYEIGNIAAAYLAPDIAMRHVNTAYVKRHVYLPVFQDAAASVFAEMRLPKATWSTYLPVADDTFPSVAAWTNAPPYAWMRSAATNAWDQAFPTLDRIDGHPYATNRTLAARTLVVSAWARVNEGNYGGASYAIGAASAAESLTNYQRAAWTATAPLAWTNALAAVGITDAQDLADLLYTWRTVRSARLDARAFGCANWCYAVIDEAWGEPNRDSVSNRHQTAKCDFDADIITDAAALRFYPQSDGTPRFAAETDIRLTRSGDYMPGAAYDDTDAYAASEDPTASEEPLTLSASVAFTGADTNYDGWAVLNLDDATAFDERLTAALQPYWQAALDYHFDTDGGVLEVESSGPTWTRNPWTASSTDKFILSNRWGRITFTATNALHYTVFPGSEGRYTFRAVGRAKMTRGLDCSSPIATAPIYDDTAIGWPTEAMWSNAWPARVTAYEIESARRSSNATNLYRTSTHTATSYESQRELRADALSRAVDAVVALAAAEGHDATIAADHDRFITEAMTPDAAAMDVAARSSPCIGSGAECAAACGMLATSGRETASKRRYTATATLTWSGSAWQFALTAKSWDSSSAGFARWAYVRPQWSDFGGVYCATNYGGYGVRVRNVHTVKTTFDSTRWAAFSIAD